jgi:hypothetical protein
MGAAMRALENEVLDLVVAYRAKNGFAAASARVIGIAFAVHHRGNVASEDRHG